MQIKDKKLRGILSPRQSRRKIKEAQAPLNASHKSIAAAIHRLEEVAWLGGSSPAASHRTPVRRRAECRVGSVRDAGLAALEM